MGSQLVERRGALLIGGLLARQFSVHRHKHDGIALGHLHQDSLQQLQDRDWDWDWDWDWEVCALPTFQVQEEAGLTQPPASSAASALGTTGSMQPGRATAMDGRSERPLER